MGTNLSREPCCATRNLCIDLLAVHRIRRLIYGFYVFVAWECKFISKSVDFRYRKMKTRLSNFTILFKKNCWIILMRWKFWGTSCRLTVGNGKCYLLQLFNSNWPRISRVKQRFSNWIDYKDIHFRLWTNHIDWFRQS